MAAKGNSKSSRRKWRFRCIAAISITLIIITAINIAATSAGAVSNAASGETSEVLVQKPSHTLSIELASNDAVITAPPGILPGHVYVLNNREIVTEKTWHEMNKSRDRAEEPSSYSETSSPTATIKASVTVTPTRKIVVDENDRIVEIWSNTTGTRRGFYSLRVSEQSRQGLEHPLTQGILTQYNRLLGEVDWSINGRVYLAEIH